MCLTVIGQSTILCLLATLPVGFSRPYLPNAHEKVSLFCGHPYVSPSAAEREGDIFGCADFWVNQSANPFSFRHHNHLAVIWRNFFLTQRSSHMRTISYLLAFAKFSLLIPPKQSLKTALGFLHLKNRHD